MGLPKAANDVSPLRDRQVKATRREFLARATALATIPNTPPARDDPIADPTIALIAEEKRWRLLAIAARASAEKVLFALPEDKRPEEFDDHPIMAEALSLEARADQVFDCIIETPAATLPGIVAKLEWAEGDAEVAESVIADLRRWLTER